MQTVSSRPVFPSPESPDFHHQRTGFIAYQSNKHFITFLRAVVGFGIFKNRPPFAVRRFDVKANLMVSEIGMRYSF
ncbi:hypothetical protein [Larkinella terrae]|uniref:Uncharacterized protein n=1 Tax=Larkinella terrae TaxID=2025311 RepID=A0A7K0EU25_9BACT|nr:hypothetical protein [Larkinella terrae]MRS65269.1 hypothetical protein [Larkinella terrae]